MPLNPGLYEQIITRLLNKQLAELDPKLNAELHNLDEEESRPMSIVWRLKFKMPSRLVRTTARLEVA